MQWSNGEVLLKRIKFHSNQECEGFYEEIPITSGSYIIYIYNCLSNNNNNNNWNYTWPSMWGDPGSNPGES